MLLGKGCRAVPGASPAAVPLLAWAATTPVGAAPFLLFPSSIGEGTRVEPGNARRQGGISLNALQVLTENRPRTGY